MTFITGPNAPLGVPATVTPVDTVARVPLGTIQTFVDPIQGPGELIYLPGVASCAAGDLVSYDLLPGGVATTRALAAGLANSGRPVAVALVPVLAGQFGWFQIGGVAIANVAGAGVVGPVFATSTAGSVSSATTAGAQISGAVISAAVGTPAAGKAYVTLDHPRAQTQIT